MNSLKTTLLSGVITALLSTAMSTTAVASQTTVDTLSQQLKVNYQVIDNHAANHGVDCSSLGGDWGSCHKATISLTNDGPAITDNNLAIYFSSILII